MNGKLALKTSAANSVIRDTKLAPLAPLRGEGPGVNVRAGFTLVELMIAMAITLLLMAGLAKSFAVISQSIKEGRSQVNLSSKVRNLNFRLRSDLRGRTTSATPPLGSTGGQGYFMYYEGPLTEHTFAMYGASPQRTLADGDTVVYPYEPRDTTNPALTNPLYDSRDAGPTYRRHGRIGDFDDYLAFTAEAPDGEWFTGKVPAYLVEDGLTGAAAMEPRVIRSKYAEIIIWASPSWQVELQNPSDPNSDYALRVAANPSAMPMYRDNDNDLVPDEIVLHQRILLIRPDLNVTRTIPVTNPFESPVLRPLNPNIAPGLTDPGIVPAALNRIYPIGNATPPDWFPITTPPPSPAPIGNQLMMREGWLVGMAPLHHFFDLSLRRIFHPDTGELTNYVAANSLEDLVQPHNRFAHVRYPGNKFGLDDTFGNSVGTSMPLLAVGWNDAILKWLGTNDPRAETPTVNAPAWFPFSQFPLPGNPTPRTETPFGSGPVNGSGLFNGWLLPHFELGDPTDRVDNPSDTPGQWQRGYLDIYDQRWDRTGEDVIATNVLAFDVRGFDPTAPVFITSGPDGEPGRPGPPPLGDDDGSGTANETALINVGGVPQPSTELGSAGSDDVLIKVTDMGIYDLVGERIMSPNDYDSFPAPGFGAYWTLANRQGIAHRGAFVDLLYPYLAGSPLRERLDQTSSVPTPRMGTLASDAAVDTNYAQFFASDLSLYPMRTDQLNSLKRSGKLVHRGTAGDIVFMQPAYDTWTDWYERDGFDQTPSLSGVVSPANESGTVWLFNRWEAAESRFVPRRPDPLPPNQYLQIDTGRTNPSEPETSAPFPIDLSAIGITVRINDPQTEEMTQFTLVEDLQ